MSITFIYQVFFYKDHYLKFEYIHKEFIDDLLCWTLGPID
jgi:hypothetical protein